MVGSAGATMVCSSAERNIASIRPTMIGRTAAWSSGGGCCGGAGVIRVHNIRNGHGVWLVMAELVPAIHV